MNKKYKKNSKLFTLILLVVIPTVIFFGTLITDVKSNEYIPENPIIDPKNMWHWNITEGDKLIYEINVSLMSEEMVMAWRTIKIINITSFENGTMEFMGPGQNMSAVIATDLYYDNSTKQLEPIPSGNGFENPYELAIFGYNGSHPYYPEKYWTPPGAFVPYLLPINDTTVNVDIMSDILNNTFLWPAIYNGYINSFDVMGNDTSENKIWFKNTADGYYINATYYNNGTLKYGKADCLMAMDSETFNVKYEIQRVFDYNITDEIEWGVKEGDTYYFGYSMLEEEGPDFNETKIDIVGFDHIYLETEFMGGPQLLEFQRVLANVSYWDNQSKTYKLDEEEGINMTVGLANNFYPFVFPWMLGVDNGNGGDFNIPFILPNNTIPEDLAFFFNNDTARMLMYKEVYITSNTLEMIGYYPFQSFKWIIDEKTGIVKISTMTMGSDDDDDGGFGTFIIFRKNMTVIESEADADGFLLYSDIVGNNQVYVNFTYSEDVDLYWAVLPENPLGFAPIPSAIPDLPLYIDIFTNNSEAINSPNFTIYYDDSMLNGVPEDDLVLYYANFSAEEWQIVKDFSIDISSNKLVVNITHFSYYALGCKDMTSLVNWSVDVGEELYFGDGRDTIRATITKINITACNITDIFKFRIPNQPEIQNFSTVYASIDIWNSTTENWDIESNEQIVAAANNYWAIGPIIFAEGGFPLLLPNKTTGPDLMSLFGMFSEFYDNQEYKTNYVKIWSSEFEEKYMKVNFTVEDGRISYFRAWMPDSDWDFFSFYRMNWTIRLQDDDLVDFILYSDLVDINTWEVKVNLTVNQDTTVAWAVLPDNPTNVSLVNALPDEISLFFDLFVNMTPENIKGNFTVHYNSGALAANGVDESELQPYMFNTEYGYWMPFPEAWYFVDTDNDKLVVQPEHTSLFTIGTDMLSQVDWSVDLDEKNTLYYGDMRSEKKIVIHEINQSGYINVTEITELNMQSFGFPDNQTFENVWADVWSWNQSKSDWDYVNLTLIAAANNYWPFAPQQYFELYNNNMGIPYLLPIGTTSSDMELILDVFKEDMQFNEIITGTDYIFLRNSTNSYFMNFSFNSDTGITRNLYGYHYNYENTPPWDYFSFFCKYNETLSIGDNQIFLDNYFVPDITMYVNFTIDGSFEFIYAMLSTNPTNKDLPSTVGTSIFYLDLMALNYTSDEYNMTLYIELPSEYNLNYIQYICEWLYNEDNEDESIWNSISLAGLGVVRDFDNNAIILNFNDISESIVSIIGLSYNPPSDDGGNGDNGGGGGGGGDGNGGAGAPEILVPVLIGIGVGSAIGTAFIATYLIRKRKIIRK
ncbi:MAG: hypothetical protein ACFFAN_02735 [Promethearchaeota archaeon]